MIATVILAHPYPKSFNHAIYKTVVSSLGECGVKTYCHDLYDEGFNPIISEDELGKGKSQDDLVNMYSEELLESKYLVFIHPNWWGQPPAILKGYIDRVFRPPHAYDFPEDASGGGLPIEKLKGKYGVVYNTANTEAEREENYFGDPLEDIWGKCVFGFCGIDEYYRKMFRVIADSSESERKVWLDEVKKDIHRLVNENQVN